MKNNFLFILILSAGLFACKNKSKVSKTETKTTTEKIVQKVPVTEKEVVMEDVQPKFPITNKYWKAIELMGEPVEMQEGMTQEPYLKISNDGQIRGHGGCNGFFGKSTLEGKNFIQFGEIAMTEMACQFKSYDQKLAEVLSMTRQYTMIGEDEMQLIVGKRAALARFKAVYME